MIGFNYILFLFSRSVYAATLANLYYSFYDLSNGIELRLSGYNEKQEEFLDFILDRLTSFTVKSDRFFIIKEKVERKGGRGGETKGKERKGRGGKQKRE